VIFVIVLYILVALVTTGSLPVSKTVAAKDYALAVAAEPFLGHVGFVLIACAALLSTGSAITATFDFCGRQRGESEIAKRDRQPFLGAVARSDGV